MAVESIVKSINYACQINDTCHLMLTGGVTAAMLYEGLESGNFLREHKINLLFGDERCVEPAHHDSNFGMVQRTLLKHGLPNSWKIQRIRGENFDCDRAAKHYESLLPKAIDVLLLGMGADGHIASLFPNAPALSERTRRMISVTGCVGVENRITISPQVILGAQSVFLLAKGKEKGVVLRSVLEFGKYTASLPVSLLLDSTWLIDSDAANELLGFEKYFLRKKNV